jgi:hypothetical protein
MTFSVQGHADLVQATGGPNIKTESLDTKTIDGIAVTGTKTTNAIPAGTIGNDRNLVITRETWYSPDFELVIQSTQRTLALAKPRTRSQTSSGSRLIRACSRFLPVTG